MNWIQLTQSAQLDEIDELSKQKNILIYKHSNRCSICVAALGRLERYFNANPGEMPFYFLDVLRDREISNAVAARYDIEHESPQALLIRNGKCMLHRSHMEINAAELATG